VSPIVGREAELAVVSERLDALAGQHGGLVLVTGEAGIGKSRLLDALVAEATDRHLPVLRGRAVEATTPVAYRPIAEALCSMVRDGRSPARRELAPFDRLLGGLIPDWRHPDDDVETSDVVIAEAVLRFLMATSGTAGCVLLLEDLQWADPETLSVVEYLAGNTVSAPILLAASWRTDQPRGAGSNSLQAIAARASVVVDLGRLGDADVASMTSALLGAASVGDDVLMLAARADGVPFLIEELIVGAQLSGALSHEGGRWVTGAPSAVPASLVDDVRRRLSAGGPDVRATVAAGAVLGRAFEWELLPAIVGRSDESTASALRIAVEQGLVEVDATGGFRFRHALSRDAVLA
jgi:predicted ATPase